MLVRKVVYGCMSDKQLGKEVKRLSHKLDAEDSVEKKVKYLNALADVASVLICRYQNDEEFMAHVINELDELKAQIKEVL